MSKKHNIAVVPGDGTGPEVVAEAVKALEAVSHKCPVDLQFKEFGLGGDLYLKEGKLLPEDVLEELRTMDAILLGAIGHPGVKPGILEKEILLNLRFKLDNIDITRIIGATSRRAPDGDAGRRYRRAE